MRYMAKCHGRSYPNKTLDIRRRKVYNIVTQRDNRNVSIHRSPYRHGSVRTFVFSKPHIYHIAVCVIPRHLDEGVTIYNLFCVWYALGYYQGGKTTYTDSDDYSSSFSVTLKKSYSNANYTIQITSCGCAAINRQNNGSFSFSSTFSGHSGPRFAYWTTKGY